MKKPKGLHIINEFLSNDEEERLISFLDDQTWNGNGVEPNGELKRRTLQFGPLFLFKSRTIDLHHSSTGMPFILSALIGRIVKEGFFNTPDNDINHLVVNEYEKGQGIMAHVDSPSLFGDTIASISLLSDCLLKFKEKRPSNNKKLAEVESIDEFAILLKRRTLLILQDESRFMFPHEISKDCIEHYENLTIERSRRVSITLRHIRQN